LIAPVPSHSPNPTQGIRQRMIEVVEAAVPVVGASGADAFAAALRATTSPLTVICRPGAPASITPAVCDQLLAVFRARPALACIALMDDSDVMVDELGPALTGLDRRRWPVALALDPVIVGVVIESIDDYRDDPWLEVTDRLFGMAQIVEWRGVHAPGLDATWPPLGGLPGLDASMGGAHLGVPRPGPAAPSAPLGPWQPLWASESGREPQQLRLGGERPDESWRLLCSVLGHEVSGATPVPGVVGWVRHDGLPGGVALMRYHDSAGHDTIDYVETSEPPGPPQEILGWALAPQSSLAPSPPFMPADACVVEAPVGMAERPVFLHQTPRPETRPLHRGDDGALGLAPTRGSEVAGYLKIKQAPGNVAVQSSGMTYGYAPAVSGRLSPRAVQPAPSDWYPTDRATTARIRRRLRREVIKRRVDQEDLLLVLPWFTIGGADLFFLALAEELVAHGYRVHAVFTGPADEGRFDHRDALLPFLSSLNCPADEQPGRSIGDVVGEIVQREHIGQMIICGGWQVYEHLPRLRFELPGLRVIDQLFNDIGHLDNNRRYARWIDLTVCAYQALANLLVDGYGEDPSRVATVYIGIDTDRFRPVGSGARRALREEIGLDPDRPVWGYAGRVSEEKCLLDFVEAIRLVGHHLPAQFLIQGDGPALEGVLAALATCPHPVVLRPFQPDQLPTLQMLDAYVLPSRVEGIPLALMEAVACGALPIATAVGGIPDLVIPGVSGYLAAPQRPGALAAALLAAARTPEWMRSEMAHEGRQRVRREMSWPRTVERYLELLTSP
jgi:glycosyltransferase involved in cell wall biosynthesis